MDRRALLHSALAGLFAGSLPRLIPPAAAAGEARPFDFETVIERARATAAAPHVSRRMDLAPPFAGLGYDAYRAIRFHDAERLFADNHSFRMDLLPPGFNFRDRVAVNLVADGTARPIAFSADLFDFDPDHFPGPEGLPPAGPAEDMGFSGIRIRHPINRPNVWDEVAVFQGASYFRAVARDTLFGLSARGLAIGTAGPEAEEFPVFTEFWVHEPQPGAGTLRLAALLDSASVAGAYEIAITPGGETVMDLRAVLFPRRDIAQAGIAPLTSMYFFGPDNRAGVDDFRDAVHDSGGLRIVTGSGERIWRPLRNPGAVEVSAFADTGPRGFGLIQRDRDFAHFQDAEAHYERRPSAWVEPIGDWGPGAVMLFELPADRDFADNIVAFWRPEAPLLAGSRQEFAYRLTWTPVPAEPLPLARVIATRGGRSIRDSGERLLVVDFDLGEIDFASLAPRATASAGEVRGLSIAPLPGGNRARVGFHFAPGAQREIEFRLVLERAGASASEVWLYRWST